MTARKTSNDHELFSIHFFYVVRILILEDPIWAVTFLEETPLQKVCNHCSYNKTHGKIDAKSRVIQEKNGQDQEPRDPAIAQKSNVVKEFIGERISNALVDLNMQIVTIH